MKHYIFCTIIMILLSSCSSTFVSETRAPSSVIDNSQCGGENICMNQTVLAYYHRPNVGRVPYIGRVVNITNDGEIEIDNQAPARNTLITKEAYKQVRCLDGLCSDKEAIDLKGAVYNIRQIFMNKDVSADQGNPNWRSMLKSNELFNECQCIGNLCKYDTVITPKGKSVMIDGLYKNGMIRSRVGSYSGYNIFTLKEVGSEEKCTNESPCECTK